MLISEVGYLYNSDKFKLSQYLLQASSYFIKKDNLDLTLKLIDLSSNLYIRENKKYFPTIFEGGTSSLNLKNVSMGTKSDIKSKITPVILIAVDKPYPEVLANIKYKMSLIFFRAGYFEHAISCIKESIRLTPAMSFLYVELASEYIAMNDVSSFRKVLNDCSIIKENGDFCKDYLERYEMYGLYPKVGSLEKAVNEFHLGNFRESETN